MATFIDEHEEEVSLEADEELTSLTEVEEEVVEEEEAPEEPTLEDSEEDDLPEKYRGKSVRDIIAMHQEAEKAIGRQGQEVGELRKLVDGYIQAQNVTQQQAHAVQDDFKDEDFFDNPKETLQKFVENHPSVKQSQAMMEQLRKTESLTKLKSAHPDYAEILTKPEFAEWIKKSNVRKRLLVQADQHYDFEAADELLSLWKERADAVNMTVESEKKQRKEAVKNASSGTSNGSAEKPSRKIYRRADLLELMQKDPDRYAALMPEIRQAYAEKRVR